MEKIIEKFYDLHLQEEQLPFGFVDKERMNKEYDAYCTLSQTLPPSIKGLFAEYVNLSDERHKAELKCMYEYGFKTAIKLLIEGMKE